MTSTNPIVRNAMACNASGGAICSRMKKLLHSGDYVKETTGATQYWQKLSTKEWDDAINYFLMHLPKGQWRETQIYEMVKEDLGLNAAMRFDYGWSRYFWGLAMQYPKKYSTEQTLGLDCFTVK